MSQIIGIDEAGRWPWAGPVVACACAFDEKDPAIQNLLPFLQDSKKLSETKREYAYKRLIDAEKRGIISFWIGQADATVIDSINIKQANRQAMLEALSHLWKWNKVNAEKIQVDGNDNYRFDGYSLPTEFIIRWDSFIPQIQAASILAKVFRDHLMIDFGKKFP